MLIREIVPTPCYRAVSLLRKRLRLKCGEVEPLNRKRKHVTDASLGLNNLRCARIRLQLAPQAQDLHIDAAVENVLVHPGCLLQMLSAERPLGCIEEGHQQGIFSFCQCDLISCRIGKASTPPIELPVPEPIPAPFRVPLRHRASRLLPSEDGANTRQQFSKAERLSEVIVGA